MAIKTSESHPIRVHWLGSDLLPAERLGITFDPGKKDPHALSGSWERDISADLSRLRTEHLVDTLICLLVELTNGSKEQLFDDEAPADWEKYPGY